VRYHVRNAAGEELVVPSLDDLHALYARGFLADEDLVRAETSDRWTAVGAMGALQGVRTRRGTPRRLRLALTLAVALVLALGFLLGR
jgi:hypothetical protein